MKMKTIDDVVMTRRDFSKLAIAGAIGAALPGSVWAQQPSQPGGPYPENFRSIHDEMIVIDGASPLLGFQPLGTILVDPWDLYKKGGADVVFTTVSSPSLEETLAYMGSLSKHMAEDPDTMLIKKVADIHEAKKTGKLGVVYQFQPPDFLSANLEWVWFFKQAGVGICQITYNQKNEFGYGSAEKVDKGLTPKGRDLIKVLEEAKIIVDVAHSGVKTALDTIEAAADIVVCSHGNARAVVPSDRNFPDEVLRAVAQKGGVCGVAGWPPFISTNNRPSMDDMIRMIDYMVNLVGIDHVGIGMDYMHGQAGTVSNEDAKALYKYLIDSGNWSEKTYPPPPWYYPEGIELPSTFFNLTGALLARGYKKEDIAKIWGGNWLRISGKVWG
jgi:membrane dipeptidase